MRDWDKTRLKASERRELRALIRAKVENQAVMPGDQTLLARHYQVDRQYVHAIVKDEERRFQNPIAWEFERARKQKRPASILALWEEFKDHPAYSAKPSLED